MPDMDPALRKQLQQSRRKVDVIVRVRSGSGDRTPDLEALGCKIRRRFWLTRSYAVTCTGAKALKIAGLEWVERVELDGTVVALDKTSDRSTRR